MEGGVEIKTHNTLQQKFDLNSGKIYSLEEGEILQSSITLLLKE